MITLPYKTRQAIDLDTMVCTRDLARPFDEQDGSSLPFSWDEWFAKQGKDADEVYVAPPTLDMPNTTAWGVKFRRGWFGYAVVGGRHYAVMATIASVTTSEVAEA